MTVNESFEDWWQRKGHLYPATMKEAVRLAFADGWYRSRKNL